MLNERLADPLLPSDVRHGWTEGQKVRAAGYFSSLAARLAGEGAQVIVNGRTEARVQAAAAQIKHWHSGATVRAVAADLGTAAGVARRGEIGILRVGTWHFAFGISQFREANPHRRRVRRTGEASCRYVFASNCTAAGCRLGAVARTRIIPPV